MNQNTPAMYATQNEGTSQSSILDCSFPTSFSLVRRQFYLAIAFVSCLFQSPVVLLFLQFIAALNAIGTCRLH